MEQLSNTSINKPAIVFEDNKTEFVSPGMQDLLKQVNEETEFKNPPKILFESDQQQGTEKFQQVITEKENNRPPGLFPSNQNQQQEQVIEKKPIDEKSLDFSTNMFIDMFDTTQYALFLQLNRRKLRNKYFPDKAMFKLAQSNSMIDANDLKKIPEDERMIIEAQQRKYNVFVNSMKQISGQLNLTDKERGNLYKPLKEMCKRNNYDIPPGWALGFAVFSVFSNRTIDLIMD